MTGNPAPRADGAPPESKPVTWGDMLAALMAEVKRAEVWRENLARDLGDDKLTASQREALQRAIAQHERRAEVFGSAWRFIWHLRSDRKLLERLHDVLAAERGDDRGESDDGMRYD